MHSCLWVLDEAYKCTETQAIPSLSLFVVQHRPCKNDLWHPSLTYKMPGLIFFHNMESGQIYMVYKATNEAIHTYCLAAWGGNSTVLDVTKLQRVILKARIVCQSLVLSAVEEPLKGTDKKN